MALRRYMVIRYAYANNGKLPFHELTMDYCWHGIDDEFAVCMVHYLPNNHAVLDEREDVLMMPSLYSHTTVFQAAQDRKKTGLFAGLTRIGVRESDTTADVVEKIVKLYGLQFEPDQ